MGTDKLRASTLLSSMNLYKEKRKPQKNTVLKRLAYRNKKNTKGNITE